MQTENCNAAQDNKQTAITIRYYQAAKSLAIVVAILAVLILARAVWDRFKLMEFKRPFSVVDFVFELAIPATIVGVLCVILFKVLPAVKERLMRIPVNGQSSH